MKTEIAQNNVIEALEKSLGVVSIACKAAGVSRTQFYEWMKVAEFKRRVDDIKEITLDFAESKLHKLIDGGNVGATIFYLKTRGKKRGYVEIQEVTVLDPNKKPSWFEE